MRRAEGRYLHPRRDVNGVHHFRVDEVKALRDAVARGDVRLCEVDFTRAAQGSKALNAKARATIADLRAEVAELRACARTAVELFLDVCPPNIRGQLEEETLIVFAAVLDHKV